MLRVVLGGLALIAVLAVLLHLSHRQQQSSKDNSGSAAAASAALDPPIAEVRTHVSEGEILANCHPHLGPNPGSVPNIDVGGRPNPAAVRLKVRFWVNGDGFVTQAVLTGASGYTAEEQEDALHYIKDLTFSVPNTPECRARQMELIGNFVEALGSTGEWTTLTELHPRYSIVGTRVVQNR